MDREESGEEMKKPKKKDARGIGAWHNDNAEGYNQALDDIEKWLPSEKEIIEILRKYSYEKQISKAIKERLT